VSQECSALGCSAYVELNTVRETRAICVWVHGAGGGVVNLNCTAVLFFCQGTFPEIEIYFL